MSWKIIHGDSRELIEAGDLSFAGGSPVHVMTDPPYGIGLEYGDTADNWRPEASYWAALRELLPPGSSLHMTVSNKHLPFWIAEVTSAGWRYLHTSVYWNRRRAGGNANGQFAYAWEPLLSFAATDAPFTLGKRMLSDVFPHTGKTSTDHPAERDLGVWRSFMSLLPPGFIFDPFLGSGTTLRAAIDLGRDALGIEREQHWVEQATLRCSQESLFAGDYSSPATLPGSLLMGETTE